MKKICEICGDTFETGEGSGKHQIRMCGKEHYFRCSVCGNLVKINTIKRIKTKPKYRINDKEFLPFHISSNDKDICIIEFIDKVCPACSRIYATNKQKETNLKRYGVESVLQLEDVRKKTYKALASEEVKEKKKNTFQKRYGVNSYLEVEGIIEKGIEASHTKEADRKRKETFIKHYGVDHPMKNKNIIERMIETNINKYGYRNAMQSPEVKQRCKLNSLERYGVDHPMKMKELASRVYNTRLEKYGDDDPFFKNNASRISNINLRFRDKLLERGYEFELEKRIGKYFYDLAYGDILVEINPTISHNSTLSYKELVYGYPGNPVSEDYHLNKALNAIENNCKLFNVWDWCDEDKFINNLIDYLNEDLCLYSGVTRKEIILEFTTYNFFEHYLQDYNIIDIFNRVILHNDLEVFVPYIKLSKEVKYE